MPRRRCLLSPRCHTHTSNAGTLLLVGRYGSLLQWWVRRCRKCQARRTSRQIIRWPTLSIFLPKSPGISVNVDYFGPLQIAGRGNSYILLFTDRFSRRVGMFAVTAAEFGGTALFPSRDGHQLYYQIADSNSVLSLRPRLQTPRCT